MYRECLDDVMTQNHSKWLILMNEAWLCNCTVYLFVSNLFRDLLWWIVGGRNVTLPAQLPRHSSLKCEANTNDSPVSGTSSIQSDHWRLHTDVWEKMRTVTHLLYSLPEKTSVPCLAIPHWEKPQLWADVKKKHKAALNTLLTFEMSELRTVCMCAHAWSRVCVICGNF